MKSVWVFPGQGSAMPSRFGKHLYNSNLEYKHMINMIAARVPVISSQLFCNVDHIPNASFVDTSVAQPTITAFNLALIHSQKELLPSPDIIIGHSLGELIALSAAGSIDIIDAVWLAQERGKAMNSCMKAYSGQVGMIACILRPGKLEDAIKLIETQCNHVQIANINSSTQLVLSGKIKEMSTIAETMKRERLSFRSIKLPVQVPFHSQYLKESLPSFALALDKIAINSPQIPVISNIDACIYPKNIIEIKKKICNQITSRVEWLKTLKHIKSGGDCINWVCFGHTTSLMDIIAKEYPNDKFTSFIHQISKL